MPVRFAILLALSGCDVAFGLTGEPSPCDLGSFDDSMPSEITQAEAFSFTDDGFGVVVSEGFSFEMTGQDLVSIDLDADDATGYIEGQLGISPEGDLLVYSRMIEPPQLMIAKRGDDGVWRTDPRPAPKGVFGGAPSGTAFGARHMLVRTSDAKPTVQEYEDTGAWKPIGEPFDLPGGGSVGLTPNGLTMVFLEAVEPGLSESPVLVKAANRESMSDSFGEPEVILSTTRARAAQILDGKHCDQLLVSDGSALLRYDR